MRNLPSENNNHQIVVRVNRDPTPEDIHFPFTLWISCEYTPHRVFEGEAGVWEFIGKLYPPEKSERTYFYQR